MPSTTAELLSLFALAQGDHGRFIAPGPTQSVLEKAYGGQYLAQALLACELHLDDPKRSPHALHATFLTAGHSARDAVVDVSTLRDGRSFSMRRAEISQDARTLFDATISFHVPEPGFRHAAPAPIILSPEESPTIADSIDAIGGSGAQMWRDEWPVLHIRYAGGATDNRGALRSEVPTSQRFWVRTIDALPDDARLHRAMLAYFSDFVLLAAALPPHGHFVSATDVPRASLNHALWLHEPARADDWLLFDQSSSWAGHGLAHSTQRIFTRDGSLVASAAQEGLIRRVAGRTG